MKARVLRTVGIGVCMALGLFGGPSGINSTTTSPFLINGDPDGSYTDPYTGSVNGGATTIPIICDDYADHVSLGESWTALVNDLSLFNQSSGQTAANTVDTVYFSGGETAGYTQAQEYIAAADLALQIFDLGTTFGSDSPDSQKRSDLSAALWAVFEPTQVPVGNAYGDIDSAAEGYLTAALATTTGATPTYTNGTNFETANGVDVKIYTPTLSPYTSPNPNTFNNKSGNDTAPQEYITITQVPEPATWAVLGVDLLGAGILGLYFRRRQSRNRS